jgi:SAM-dependent methyltransferase
MSKTAALAQYPAASHTGAGGRTAGCRPGFSTAADDPILRLGRWLQQQGFSFVTPTPATHARVNARPGAGVAQSLRDIFGWSRPFSPALLPPPVLRWLEDGNVLESGDGLVRSKVRFSTLGDSLYVHSAYPTIDSDAVFFGPDTYRFAALIQRTLAASRAKVDRIVDIGCGTGAGGIVAAKTLQHAAAQLILTDINAAALRYARINAELAATPNTSFRQGDLFAVIDEPVDLIVANPPYLLDPGARLYRHGGGEMGSGLSTRIVVEGLPRLSAHGTLILYTGSPIVDGRDTFWESVAAAVQTVNVRCDYAELDPDVFGEELDVPAYAQVDRIAVVALVVTKSGPGLNNPAPAAR